jgi:knotted carbamoyltransferase YgeW
MFPSLARAFRPAARLVPRAVSTRAMSGIRADATDEELLNVIAQNGSDFYNGDFLLTWDFTAKQLDSFLATAMMMKRLYNRGEDLKTFTNGLGVPIFRDNSTRTRFSFASGCNMLGLEQMELDEGKSQIAHGETVRETATMISFLAQAIGIRDDMYIHEGHKYMKEVSDALQESYDGGILNQRPAVINLQCDKDHPTQSTADMLHLIDQFGSTEALKGKKMVLSWAYSPSYGKPLSVAQGITTLMTRYGMDVVLAHPEGYDVLPECRDIAARHAEESGGSFRVTNDMDEAFEGAHIVYPKSWAPFTVMEKRTELLRAGDDEGLKTLEADCLANNARFKDWECTEEKMATTHNGEALYMHCLPADITGVSCEEGEVSGSVFERYRLRTYAEASHKPFTIASMMLLCRNPNAADFLRSKC